MILNKWLPSRSSIIPWYIKKASSRKIERSRWTNHPCHLHFLQALVPKYWIESANLSDAATSMLALQTSSLASLFTALNLPLIRQHLKLCSFFAFYSTFLDSAELEAHPFFISSKIWWTDAWLFTNVFCSTDLVTWNYPKVSVQPLTALQEGLLDLEELWCWWHHSAHLLLVGLNLWLPWLHLAEFIRTHQINYFLSLQ